MNNIQDINNKYCSGCGACVAICPTRAIEYKLNYNGFYQAFVDERKCIKCGKCKKVCSRFCNIQECIELSNGICYSAQSLNYNTIISCTSGGIAYEIAKWGLGNSYKIVGVLYDYDINRAKTVIIDSIEDLEKIKGSKYIQSDTSKAFYDIIENCKNDKSKKYIIFGTPCQIVGIKKAIELENIRNEVITIDLFCHGVPSYLFWIKYLSEIKKVDTNELTEIKFRDKKFSWHEYYIKMQDSKGKEYIQYSDNDNFYKMFFDSILLNDACQSCEFRKEKSCADIRLGDFWGKRYAKREDGVSAILVFNNKSKKIIELLEKEKYIKILDKNLSEECLKEQSTHDYKFGEFRKEAFMNLRKNSYNTKKIIKLYRRRLPMKKKIKHCIQDTTKILPNCVRRNIRKLYKGR